jgi:hypothetical protein
VHAGCMYQIGHWVELPRTPLLGTLMNKAKRNQTHPGPLVEIVTYAAENVVLACAGVYGIVACVIREVV